MTLPNFLVIGAGRSGTTSLHHYLGQHPQGFLPAVKAPSYFFCGDHPGIDDPVQRALTRHCFIPDFDDYQALFDPARDEKAIGGVSPVYLATTRAAARIADRLPDVRLIAILRHPVDRAYARFLGRARYGLELRTDLRRIVSDERKQGLVRDRAFGTYIASGFCAHVLQTYFDRFPRARIRIHLFEFPADRIQVHLFEELTARPAELLARLFAFIGVDSSVEIDTRPRCNRSGEIKGTLRRFLWTRSVGVRTALRPHLPEPLRNSGPWQIGETLDRPTLAPDLRARLEEALDPDVERLAALLDRDLRGWRRAQP